MNKELLSVIDNFLPMGVNTPTFQSMGVNGQILPCLKGNLLKVKPEYTGHVRNSGHFWDYLRKIFSVRQLVETKLHIYNPGFKTHLA